VRLRLLAERGEERWSVKEMRAVLIVGGVSLDGLSDDSSDELPQKLRRMTKALARAATAQWEEEEIAAVTAREDDSDDGEDGDSAFGSRQSDDPSHRATGGGAASSGDGAAGAGAAGTRNTSALLRARRAMGKASRAVYIDNVCRALRPSPTKPSKGSTRNQSALARARSQMYGARSRRGDGSPMACSPLAAVRVAAITTTPAHASSGGAT